MTIKMHGEDNFLLIKEKRREKKKNSQKNKILELTQKKTVYFIRLKMTETKRNIILLSHNCKTEKERNKSIDSL